MTAFYRRVAKRALDVCIAGLALTVLAPVMALVAVAVRSTMGAPVLFRQRRPGLHGRPFAIFNFRTMRELEQMPAGCTEADRLSATGRCSGRQASTSCRS